MLRRLLALYWRCVAGTVTVFEQNSLGGPGEIVVLAASQRPHERAERDAAECERNGD